MSASLLGRDGGHGGVHDWSRKGASDGGHSGVCDWSRKVADMKRTGPLCDQEMLHTTYRAAAVDSGHSGVGGFRKSGYGGGRCGSGSVIAEAGAVIGEAETGMEAVVIQSEEPPIQVIGEAETGMEAVVIQSEQPQIDEGCSRVKILEVYFNWDGWYRQLGNHV